MNNGFTHQEAVTLWQALVDSMFNATLSYAYYERMAPSHNYSVTIPVGPGIFSADRLKRAMEIADDHDADCHFIGNAIAIFKR